MDSPIRTYVCRDHDEIAEDVVPLLGDEHCTHSRSKQQVTGQQLGIVLYFMAIHFLLAFCEIILVAPMIKLFENSLCLNYYQFPSNGVEESLCKIPEIQRPLATIRGWKSMFDTIPGEAICFVNGILLISTSAARCDTYWQVGRSLRWEEDSGLGFDRGFWITHGDIHCAFPEVFPLQTVWLSSVILLCGGGLNSASAFMWAMASASFPLNQRSHAFYYIFSAFYIAEFISSYVASMTMDISPWIPCGFAIGSIAFCLSLLGFIAIPEKQREPTPSPFAASGTSEDGAEEPLVEFLPKYSSIDVLLSVLSTQNVRLTIPVFLVGILRYATLNMLIQYASVRFGLKISTGATFYTETAIVNIFLFLFFIPWSTKILRSTYHVNPQAIDLFLVRVSVLLMCAGCLIIGLAQTSRILPIGVFVFASGFGSRVSALALVSYWISDDMKTTLYAAIIVLESVGHAIGDPVMQQIFATSLQLPSFWTALPFFVAAGFYLSALISSSFIRIERFLQL